MVKFEYKSVVIDLNEDLEIILNEYGEAGWELASFTLKPNSRYALAIFKRITPKGK
jgi:hypothetical protein